MPYEFGDVVLLRFPFTNLTATKQRPAVIVSSASYNSSRSDVVIMAVTSQFRSVPPLGEVPLEDWRSADLLKPSVVKPVFATLEQQMIIRSLGRLSEVDTAAVRQAIVDTLH